MLKFGRASTKKINTMSNWDFLKTGFGAETESTAAEDFTRNSAAMLKVLADQAVNTAADFSAACGRSQISGGDMIKALQYETHEFFARDYQQQHTAYLQALDTDWPDRCLAMGAALEASGEESESDGTESDEEESTGSAPGESSDELEEAEEWPEGNEPTELVASATTAGARLHSAVMSYHLGWNAWEPVDPVEQLLKRAVDQVGHHGVARPDSAAKS